ncbi:MAG: DUF6293 family protein [Candidatus Bathyarchaeia archaeon]
MQGIKEIVHVIPLGHEYDRVVKPFERHRPNRVYLLTITDPRNIPHITEEMFKRQEYFLTLVRTFLEERGIEVIVENTNIFDVLDVLRQVSRIVRMEKQRNNIVYVNMSGAGRLTSVAATLAAMAHDAIVYYVMADRYAKTDEEELKHGLSICQDVKVIELVNFHISLPDKTSLKLLAELCKREKGMKTDEILDFLKKLGIEEFDEKSLKPEVRKDKRRSQQILLNRLNKKMLDKLEAEGYVEREKSGRYNIIKITETGRYAAYISGFVD